MGIINRFQFSMCLVWRVSCRKYSIYQGNKLLPFASVNPIRNKYLFIPQIFTNHVRFAKRAQKMSKGGKPKRVKLTDEELSEVIDVEGYYNQLCLVKEKLKKNYIDNLSLRSSSNIENILVKIEDQEYPLHELAQISRKGQNLVAINMVDFPEALKPAIQSLTDSGGNLNPQQDGTMIYLTIPKMTREHRESLVKNAKSLFTKAKEEVKIIQNNFIKEAKKKTDLSEDLVFNASNQIMSIAEETVSQLEQTLKVKQKELLNEN